MKKRKAKIETAINSILNLIADDEFIKKHAPYIRAGNNMIASKIIEVLNSKKDKLDLKAQLEGLKKYLDKSIPNHGLKSGYSFILPYPTIIGLPSFYNATRLYVDKGFLYFCTVVNVYTNIGSQQEPDLIGFSYIVAGKLFKTNPVKPDLSEVLNYVNDVLTAYKLVRHDHNIKNVNRQKLPSHISQYKVDIEQNIKLEKLNPLRLHSNDLMDTWAKRYLDSKEEMQKFVEYSERLPTFREVRYLLNLMVNSITNFCLGDLEDTVLDSDRFAELALRYCFTKTPSFISRNVKDIHNLYSKADPDNAVLNILLNEFSLKGNHIVSLWYKHSRNLRNDLVHGLKFDELTRNKAQKALKYNLEIVSLIAEKVPAEDWSLKLLKLGKETYDKLFE